MAWVQHGGVNPKSTKVKHDDDDDDDDDYDYYYYDYDDDDDDDGEYQCLVMVSGGYPWLMIIGYPALPSILRCSSLMFPIVHGYW